MPENGQVLFTKTRKIIEGKIFNDIMDVGCLNMTERLKFGNATTDEVATGCMDGQKADKELLDAGYVCGPLVHTEVDQKC